MLQSYNWWEINKALSPEAQQGGSYLGLFYMLTGLHAAHVVGGLIPLGIVLFHFAIAGSYKARQLPSRPALTAPCTGTFWTSFGWRCSFTGDLSDLNPPSRALPRYGCKTDELHLFRVHTAYQANRKP